MILYFVCSTYTTVFIHLLLVYCTTRRSPSAREIIFHYYCENNITTSCITKKGLDAEAFRYGRVKGVGELAISAAIGGGTLSLEG